MINSERVRQRKAEPYWLHAGVLVLLHAGSRVSLLVSHDVSVSDFYLPTAMAVLLINWLPIRYVLPALYLNAVSTSYLWGNSLANWPLWFVFAMPETLYAFLSWALFRFYKGKCWLPDIRNLVIFMAVGILIPAIVETFMLQTILLLAKVQSAHTYWQYVTSNLLSEFATTFLLTIPALYFVTPVLVNKGLVSKVDFEQPDFRTLTKREMFEVAIAFALLFALAFVLDFKQYWYIYGFFSLYLAIRFGFGAAIMANFYIIALTYITPQFFRLFGQEPIENLNDSMDVLLGANVLFVFAAVTGRVISDVKNVQCQLLANNEVLEKTNVELANANLKLDLTNRELDRFAYSVSHDLSAPLKTIQGVVNISRLTDELSELKVYLEKIGTSAEKLQTFIHEVLDYARNNRQDPQYEDIDLYGMCTELIQGLENSESKNSCKVVTELQLAIIRQDRSLLKIILNNLLSNAMRFQRQHDGHQPTIRISSHSDKQLAFIEIEDNGEGITPEVQSRMFEMFYRGSLRSQGAGLGLYIASSVAAKIDGSISYRSEYGKGSTFIVTLPLSPRGHS